MLDFETKKGSKVLVNSGLKKVFAGVVTKATKASVWVEWNNGQSCEKFDRATGKQKDSAVFAYRISAFDEERLVEYQKRAELDNLKTELRQQIAKMTSYQAVKDLNFEQVEMLLEAFRSVASS